MQRSPHRPESRRTDWLARVLGVFRGGSRPPSRGGYVARSVQEGSPPRRDPVLGATVGRRGYGTQARRLQDPGPYVMAFFVISLLLAAFLWVGLRWATGSGREAGLGPGVAASPSPAILAAPSPSPVPATPTPVTTYVVQAGDTPAEIARKLNVSPQALMDENGITDPRSLQVGQTLKVPKQP